MSSPGRPLQLAEEAVPRPECTSLSQKNPFRIPSDNEIFAIRDRLRNQRATERQTMQNTAQYLRGIARPRETFRHLTQLPPPKASAEEEALAQLILTPDASDHSEGLRDFIDQKREIFLAQLSIETKREELQRLERLEREEAQSLAAKEAEITMFREQFRAFLEADSKSTMEARRAAEEKSKQRLEVALKIKQVSTEISSLRNDIAHLEDKLQECEGYREFVESLTPPEWRQQHPLPELYFKEPQQMIDIMQGLEGQNKFLMQHCQEAEEVLERFKDKFNTLLEERDGSMQSMVKKREESQATLQSMNDRNEMYKVVGDFRHGNEFSESEGSELLEEIKKFHQEIGYETAATDKLTMLKRIEDKMEELVMDLAKKDKAVVAKLFAEKVHRRAENERAEEEAKQQKEQQEKQQRALHLATMPIKKKNGRPVVARMLPQKMESREKREEQMRIEAEQREADKYMLYGPIWD